MTKTKYGAFYNRGDNSIVWFRTARLLDKGYYRRHARCAEPPDVYVAASVAELIMKTHAWIQEEEALFQRQSGRPGVNAANQKRISANMTDQLVQRLDPHDDAIWVDEPLWVKQLHRCEKPCALD